MNSFLDSPDYDASYPRPQLRRADWTNLDGEWRFCFDDEARFAHPDDIKTWTRTIRVPFAPETPASGIHDQKFHRSFWYEREFDADANDGRVLLHFGAADYHARVWVNGQFAGEHSGGHTPFTIEATSLLRSAGPQTVTVWVEDDPHDLAKPRGKQDWQEDPHSIWYPRTSGLWQTVWMEKVADTYLERLRWVPHFERWEIGIEAALNGIISADLQLRITLSCGGKPLADDIYRVLSGEVQRRVVLSDPGIDDYRNELLWSPEKPTLIEARIELLRGGVVIDKVASYTAMRTVSIQRNRFLLNGRPYHLRLVLDQGYWPESHLTPPNTEALEKDVLLVKAMGFNGVRKHQKIEDPRFLFWADALGIVVWEEMPSAYRFTEKSVRRLTSEWMEAIERDQSHPCIVAWVPFNESWGVPDLTATAAHRHYVEGVYHLTKSLDPTRPVIGNDGWENLATDIVGIHDYEGDPVTLARRYGSDVPLSEFFERLLPAGRVLALEGYDHSDQAVMLTEFGGIAYAQRGTPDGEKAWGYVRSETINELERSYGALLAAVNRVPMFAGFCYTQFTDTFQEANGLLNADRSPKFPLEAIAAATHGHPLVRDGQVQSECGGLVQAPNHPPSGLAAELSPGLNETRAVLKAALGIAKA